VDKMDKYEYLKIRPELDTFGDVRDGYCDTNFRIQLIRYFSKELRFKEYKLV
jgi:hypothetical protein